MRKFIDIINEALRPTRIRGDLEQLRPGISTGGEIAPAGTRDVTAPMSHTANAHDTFTQAVANQHQLGDVPVGSILRDLERATGTSGINRDHVAFGAVEPRGADPFALPDHTGAQTENLPAVQPVYQIAPEIERTPNNLPAVVSSAIEAFAEQPFAPKWHKIGNLPGMMLRAIEMIGGRIFGQFTDYPLREISMITTAMNMNPTSDVQKMMALIKNNGQKEDDLNYDFSDVMPGYQQLSPENRAQLWRAFGYEFLLMKDAGGYYVYAWPETDKEISDNTPRPRLG